MHEPNADSNRLHDYILGLEEQTLGQLYSAATYLDIPVLIEILLTVFIERVNILITAINDLKTECLIKEFCFNIDDLHHPFESNQFWVAIQNLKNQICTNLTLYDGNLSLQNHHNCIENLKSIVSMYTEMSSYLDTLNPIIRLIPASDSAKEIPSLRTALTQHLGKCVTSHPHLKEFVFKKLPSDLNQQVASKMFFDVKSFLLSQLKMPKETISFGKEKSVRKLCFSRDGKILAIDLKDQLLLYEISSKEIITHLPFSDGQQDPGVFGGISQDFNECVYFARVDRGPQTLNLINISTLQRIEQFESTKIEKMVYTPVGEILIAIREGTKSVQEIKIINLSTKKTIISDKINDCEINHISHIALSNDGNILAISFRADGDDQDFIILWNIRTGERITRLENEEDPNHINYLCFNHDDSILASCQSSATVTLWDLKTNSYIRTIELKCSHTVHPDELEDMGIGIEEYKCEDCRVEKVYFSPDSSILFIKRESETLDIYDVQKDCFIGQINFGYDSHDFALNADGLTLALGRGNGIVELYSLEEYYATKHILDTQLSVEDLSFLKSVVKCAKSNDKLNLVDNQKYLQIYKSLPILVQNIIKEIVILPKE